MSRIGQFTCFVVTTGCLFFGTACHFGQGSDSGQAPGAVAEVAGQVIRPGEISFPDGNRSPDARRARVDAAVASAITATEARRRGLATDEETQARLAAIRAESIRREREVLQNALYQQVRNEVLLTDKDLRAHYQATRRRYAERQLVIKRIIYPSERAASAALINPESVAGNENAEELGPKPLAELSSSVLPEAARLRKVGDRGLAVSDDGEWALIELVEVHPALPRPFESVREQVEKSLRVRRGGAAWKALLLELRDKTKVVIHEEVLMDESYWSKPAARS